MTVRFGGNSPSGIACPMNPTQSSPDPLDAALSADGGRPLLRTAVIRFSSLGEGDLASWVRLAGRAAEPNPFFRPDFVAAAATAHKRDPALLVVTSGDEWIACLPVEPGGRWRRLWMPVLAPWMPNLGFLATPLVDESRLADAADALAVFLAGEQDSAALVLDPIHPDGPVAGALRDAFAGVGIRPTAYEEWERGALRRRAEATYVDESMSAKRRKEWRRQRRALERELGATATTVDRSSDPDACEEFLRLERESWKGDAGTALASTPEGIAFFREMCSTSARDGILQMLALEVGGRTVAMQCNLLDGRVLFGYKVAYDRELARFSPGAQLEVDGIRVFHESGAADAADSCAAPDSDVVNRIWPDRRPLQTLIVPTGSARARLIGPAVAAEAIGRRVVRGTRARLRARAGDAPRP
jgi:CelD/BcsL family acetyltransferase involved in cellulose biosynthesis